MMSITKGEEKKNSLIKPIVQVAERVRSGEEDKRRLDSTLRHGDMKGVGRMKKLCVTGVLAVCMMLLTAGVASRG